MLKHDAYEYIPIHLNTYMYRYIQTKAETVGGKKLYI